MDEATTQVNDEIARLKAENEQVNTWYQEVGADLADQTNRAEQAESDLRACAPIVKAAMEQHCRVVPRESCGVCQGLASLPEDTKARMGL